MPCVSSEPMPPLSQTDMARSYPIASDGLQIEEAGSEAVVFDPSAGQFHLLNAVARHMLTSCNGLATPMDIAASLAHTFDLQGRSLTAVTSDVLSGLEQFHKKGLIAFVTDADAMGS